MSNVTVAFMSRSILHTHQFSWVFLVDWILILILTIFVLFYFNQLLGFIVSQTFCRYLWYRYGVFVKIQSIQISLLGGRLLFRNVTYIGTSQAVRIVHGSLNWRYWIPKRRRSAFITQTHLEDSQGTALELKVSGVEWFVYNREYAYEVLATKNAATAKLARQFENWQQGLSYIERKFTELLPLHIIVRYLGIVIGNDDTESLVVMSSPDVDVLVDMAAASNKYDRYMNCVHAKFHKPEVELQDNPDYQVSSITPDRQYRKNRFSKNRRRAWTERFKKRSKRNQEQPWLGLKRYTDNLDDSPHTPRRRKTFSSAKETKRPSETDAARSSTKRGSVMFEDDLDDEPRLRNHAYESERTARDEEPKKMTKAQVLSNIAALPVEYAKVSQLLACDTLTLKFHVDVVGKANMDSASVRSMNKDSAERETDSENTLDDKVEANSRTDGHPIFDIELKAHNTKINYGPYAERQRQLFYSVYFPRNCTDATLPEYSSTGTPILIGLRAHPKATVSIDFSGDTTCVVPVRELSKDDDFIANYLKSLPTARSDIQRTYGWLEVGMAEGSNVSINMPFIPDSTGFDTVIKVQLTNPDVRSSVNHDAMFSAESHAITITQHQPLKWNGLNVYTIGQKSKNLNFYSLREHAILITDMMTDFATGPPIPYALFTPTKYFVDWKAENFSLFLNVNKGNIINKPTSLSENTFLILRTPELFAHWDVPRDLITSPVTVIKTTLEAPIVELELSAPNWHTLHGFLDSQKMARVDNLKIVMENFMAVVPTEDTVGEKPLGSNHTRFIDTQVFDISGEQFAMTAHGFLIDYIMRIRENYFGHMYHFQTTEEFLQKHEANVKQEETFDFTRTALDNDSQMRIRVEKGCFLLPTRLYSCRDCISLQFVQLNADCRFTNYYMDLQVEVTPLTGRLLRGLNPGTSHEEALQMSFYHADVSVSQIEVHAHRMFGLPPSEPTYVVRWDFEIGDITADFALDFWTSLTEAGLIFGHSFTDDENKPILAPEELNDVTFVSINIASAVAIVRPSKVASANKTSQGNNLDPRFCVSTSHIKMRVDDLANARYSAHRMIEVPFIGVKGYSCENLLVFEAQTALYSTTFVTKPNSQEFYQKQQEHVALHDALFHRASFLLDNKHRWLYEHELMQLDDAVKPCIPLKPFDPPLTRENLKHLDPKFVVMGDRRHSEDSSQNPSLESLVSDNIRMNNSSDSSDDDATVPRQVRNARAQGFNPSPDVYPFSAATVTAEREKLRSRKTHFGLNPTQWHANAPSLNSDDEVENIDLIFQIMPVAVSVTPGVFSLYEAFDKETDVDFEAQLDRLQIQIVRGLVREESIQEVFRAHVVTPLITVDFKDTLLSSDGLRLEINHIDAMLKVSGNTRGANATVSSLMLSLRHGSQDQVDVTKINVVSVLLSKLTLWWQETAQEDVTGELKLDSVDSNFAAESVEWAISYMDQLVRSIPSQLQKPGKKQQEPGQPSQASFSGNEDSETVNSISRQFTKQEKLKATFFALTMAGERMGVEQDSYVLSRPAGAVQSKAHVRTKTSWRLVMRLRYLLQRLPPAEKLKMQNEISAGTFNLPDDAKSQAVKVYKRWRSWEQSKDLAETEIFKLVFDDKTFQEYVLSLTTRLYIEVESMVARIVYPDTHDHFVGLDSLQTQILTARKNKTQNLNLTFRCAKARARGSMEILAVTATIIAAISRVEEERRNSAHAEDHSDDTFSSLKNVSVTPIVSGDPSMKHSEAAASSDSESKEQTKALQATISIFLLDFVTEFDLETLRLETQNHQIQFTSSVELMETAQLESLFHTGTLVTSDGAFRIFQQSSSSHAESQRRDIIDSLVQGIQVGYAGKGSGPQGNTWATATVETVSFISHPTALQLAEILAGVVEKDLPVICSTIHKLQLALPKHQSDAIATVNSIHPAVQSASTSSLPRDHIKTNEKRLKAMAEQQSTTDSDKFGLATGHYLNMNIKTIKIRASLVGELRFVLQGKDLVAKMRHTDAFVNCVELARSVVGVHFGDGSAFVASAQLENARSILRYDSDLRALAVFNSAASVRLETMSLIWMLEYARHRHIDTQIMQFMKQVDIIFAMMEDLSSKLKSHSVEEASQTDLGGQKSGADASVSTTMTTKLRLVNHVEEISVRLPLDTSSFRLVIGGVRQRYENFETFEKLGESSGNESPEVMVAGIDELRLELHTPRKPLREMVRLKFEAFFHKEDGKIFVDISSNLIRFALDPEAVGAIFIALEKLKENSQDMFTSKHFQSTTFASKPEGIARNQERSGIESSEGSIFDLENVRVKLLLKQLTITWFTSPDSTGGIILGFDELSIRVARLISHAELRGVYMTPVSKSRSEIKNRMNTLYLPYIQANAFVTKDKEDKRAWIQGDINGKSVVLTITPSVALWIMSLVDSFNETNETLERLAQLRRSSRQASETLDKDEGENTARDSSSLERPEALRQFPFNVRINTHFDRGILKLMEENHRSKDAAMELFSPKLDLYLEFKDNNLLLRIDLSKTTNKIFPKAISEIKAITTMIGLSMKQRAAERFEKDLKVMKKSNSAASTEPNSPAANKGAMSGVPSPTSSVPQASADAMNIFDHYEMDIRIHCESQDIYLSCLPFGKVGALLATDGMDVIVTAPRNTTDNPSCLSFYGLLKKTKISLQHIYSREVSAMIAFSRLTTLAMYRRANPLRVAANLSQPELDLDLSKLHDMRIFFDIWTLFENSATETSDSVPAPEPRATSLRRKYSTSNNSKGRPKLSITTSSSLKAGHGSIFGDEISADSEQALDDAASVNSDRALDDAQEERLIDRYKRAMSSVPFAFLINFTVSDLSINLGMGPAIGDSRITMDRSWLSVAQSVTLSQTVHAGLDSVVGKFNGRFGGTVNLDGIMAKVALQWKETQSYPLAHLKFRIKNYGFYFSLDFHPFITGSMNNLAMVLTTQDEANAQEDRVHVALTCDSVSIVFTALVVAHALDVLSLFKRLQSHVSSAHVFMPEVAQEHATRSEAKQNLRKQRILDHQSSGSGKGGVRVLFDVHFGDLLIHAFPTEFVDSMALKIFVQRCEVHCDRKHLQNDFETGLDLAVDECVVGLASIKGGTYNKTLTDLDYEGFLRYVSKSTLSSTIVNTPEVTILMDTWQNARDSDVVYYTFSNEVHGSIEVGWNYGSVNFIKEMISAHQDAWEVRQNVQEASLHSSAETGSTSTAQAYREAAAHIERQGSLSSSHRKKGSSSLRPSRSDMSSSFLVAEEIPIDEGDDDPDSSPTIILQGIKYIAKKPPVILIPQLRDLGDATPPIEWLGVNRQRIPSMLHYFLTRKLAAGSDEIEKAYLDVIGRIE